MVTVCREPTYDVWGGLEEGVHRVKMQARLADTEVLLETDEVEIDLRCADHDVDPGDSCSAGGTSSTSSLLVALLGLMRVRRQRRSFRR